MVRQAVEVFVRIRPRHPDLPSGLRVVPPPPGQVIRSIEASVPRGANKGGWVNNTTERLQFTFKQVFDEAAAQDAVYSVVVAPLVSEFLGGVNCTVLAYGQTGSGKTYSMVGGGKYRDRGAIPRAIHAIFGSLSDQTAAAAAAAATHGGDTGSFALYVSYCEIYEEKVFDLLDRAAADRPIELWPRVQVRRGGTREKQQRCGFCCWWCLATTAAAAGARGRGRRAARGPAVLCCAHRGGRAEPPLLSPLPSPDGRDAHEPCVVAVALHLLARARGAAAGL